MYQAYLFFKHGFRRVSKESETLSEVNIMDSVVINITVCAKIMCHVEPPWNAVTVSVVSPFFKRTSKHTTAVPFLLYGHTVPIDNGKQMAQQFAQYSNNRHANISSIVFF